MRLFAVYHIAAAALCVQMAVNLTGFLAITMTRIAHLETPRATQHTVRRDAIRIAELSQRLRVAVRVIAQEDPFSPALPLITRTLIRDGQTLSFSGSR